jgi:protein SCO1
MRPVRSAALAGVLLLALAGCSVGRGGGTAASVDAGAERVAYHGVEPDPVPQRPSFVLRDTAGDRFDFRSQTSGRPTYLYFGYTSCPDECPTAMADVAAALRRSPADLREQVRVVFVTTDPERDTGPLLRRWLDQFDTTAVGLLGTQQEVEAAQRAVGLSPATRGGELPTLPGQPDAHEHQPGTAPHEHFGPLGYAVDHANVIFAYDASDRLPVLYTGGVLPADLAADLPALARQEEPT